MKIQDVAFCVTDWSKVETVEHRGTTGAAFWRTLELGNIRVRMVEYIAFEPRHLAALSCVFTLYSAAISVQRRRLALVWFAVTAIGYITMDRCNILVEYEIWLKRGMPLSGECSLSR